MGLVAKTKSLKASKEVNYVEQATCEFQKPSRLQNSPYFCVFKSARAVKEKVWKEAKNRERDWEETLKIRLTRFARIRLLRHALPISLLILRKKTTVLQSKNPQSNEFYLRENEKSFPYQRLST